MQRVRGYLASAPVAGTIVLVCLYDAQANALQCGLAKLKRAAHTREYEQH